MTHAEVVGVDDQKASVNRVAEESVGLTLVQRAPSWFHSLACPAQADARAVPSHVWLPAVATLVALVANRRSSRLRRNPGIVSNVDLIQVSSARCRSELVRQGSVA